ncbi:MAG: hypothetical protein ABJG47_09505 [Ekhidna sp.]
MIELWLGRKSWAAMLTALLSFAAVAQEEERETDFELELQFENRYFFSEGLYSGQERNYLSLAVKPAYELSWQDGDHSLKMVLFGRFDQHDDNRTHADIRELYYQRVKGSWELSLGWKKVFWGVTESAHLVDIINQTDQVESFDGEQKLGQPMAHFSYLSGVGTLDFFYLPYARKRQFAASGGRLRFPTVIERDDFSVDHDLEEWYPSGAFRWSNYFGVFDTGLSYFHGVGREPLFLNLDSSDPQFFYPIINQVGVDIQATTGPLLLKLEAIHRQADQQSFESLAGGVEFTFGNIKSSGIDLGLIAEYLYDSRDELAISNLANDLFTGFRLAFNDAKSTEILAGGIFDLEKSTKLYSIEASRRIASSWKVEVEARIFADVSNEEFLYFFREDSFGKFALYRYF